ncbi:glycine-rich RNA-binding protein 3, mitochondrial [Iris pallida]|uniref:Glycine-rich RNA-binding protein 3, mitochondrial n=1 Tax=Iris pallida TaxID=29817 RepID=A0AAX6G803_IRIPA|nr:glycine-rich RNA-binding protein 3, mitochondrial [Iris pallida]
MDPTGEQQLDYGDDFASPRFHHHPSGGGDGAAVTDEEIDDDFDDLFNYVNVGEIFARAASRNPAPHPVGYGSWLPPPDPNPKLEPPPFPIAPSFGIPFSGADRNPNPNPNPNPRVPDLLRFRFPAVNRPSPPVDPRGGPTTLFVGELLWWTTDEEIESAASRYGRVKEVKFFDERPSGRSKGYCQVEFHDAASAAACKEGMDGCRFNGRACAVAFASPQALQQMEAPYADRNPLPRQTNDGKGRGGGGGGERGFGGGGWGGRGGGQGGGGMTRTRGSNWERRMMRAADAAASGGGNGVGAGGPYGQGLAGPQVGGLLHPQGPTGADLNVMMARFQAMNVVGLPGAAPRADPSPFGRGTAANAMGGMGGQMWGGASIGGGWTTRESSYGGDDGGSGFGYGDERGGRSCLLGPGNRDAPPF